MALEIFIVIVSAAAGFTLAKFYSGLDAKIKAESDKVSAELKAKFDAFKAKL